MIAQLRAYLERYRAASGARVDVHCIKGVGHSPQLERPEEFAALLLGHMDAAAAEAAAAPSD